MDFQEAITVVARAAPSAQATAQLLADIADRDDGEKIDGVAAVLEETPPADLESRSAPSPGGQGAPASVWEGVVQSNGASYGISRLAKSVFLPCGVEP